MTRYLAAVAVAVMATSATRGDVILNLGPATLTSGVYSFPASVTFNPTPPEYADQRMTLFAFDLSASDPALAPGGDYSGFSFELNVALAAAGWTEGPISSPAFGLLGYSSLTAADPYAIGLLPSAVGQPLGVLRYDPAAVGVTIADLAAVSASIAGPTASPPFTVVSGTRPDVGSGQRQTDYVPQAFFDFTPGISTDPNDAPNYGLLTFAPTGGSRPLTPTNDDDDDDGGGGGGGNPVVPEPATAVVFLALGAVGLRAARRRAG